MGITHSRASDISRNMPAAVEMTYVMDGVASM